MLSSGKVSSLCASLNSVLGSFDIEKVCSLVEKYYPADFSNQERMQLECQLPHFQLDVCNHPELKGLSSLADLTSGLVKLDKDSSYPMVDKLLRLLLTLSVSTATTERAFSAMKFVKTRLRSKMGDAYLWDYLVVNLFDKIDVVLLYCFCNEDYILTYALWLVPLLFLYYVLAGLVAWRLSLPPLSSDPGFAPGWISTDHSRACARAFASFAPPRLVQLFSDQLFRKSSCGENLAV
jgi:hypothetical protein